MVAKTHLTAQDFEHVLSQFAVGTFVNAEPITAGTVQTNYLVRTTEGRCVFRWYENRSTGSVQFECHLLEYLAANRYPCAAPIKNKRAASVDIFRHKPFMLFEYIDGQHIQQAEEKHKRQLIQIVAELQKLTVEYISPYREQRWNYSVELCSRLAREQAAQLNTASAHAKAAWLDDQLTTLQLPPELPKAICHCDFDWSNVLFQDDKLVALLDFDDANHTFTSFDLASLIDSWAWPHYSSTIEWQLARSITHSYRQHRPVERLERHHLFDVYKLSILFDCIWFFSRGELPDFYEKQKIDFLDKFGRENFVDVIFHG